MKKLLLFCLIVRCGIAVTGPEGLASSDDDESSSDSESEIDKMSSEEFEARMRKADQKLAESEKQLRQCVLRGACLIFEGTDKDWHVDKTPLAQVVREAPNDSLRFLFAATAKDLLWNHVCSACLLFTAQGYPPKPAPADTLDGKIKQEEQTKAQFLRNMQSDFPHFTPAIAVSHPELHDLPQIITESVPVEETRDAINNFLFHGLNIPRPPPKLFCQIM